MKKIAVITGVTGQDGALLSNFLLNKGYYVVGVARHTSAKTDWRLRELNLYNNNNFIVTSGDLADASSISRIVKYYEPEEFYNLGAMSFVKESWNTPQQTININAIGTVNCLEALRQFAPSCRFYQASTSEMFGGYNRKEMLNEESKFYPRSPYGISKLAAHWATINYRESYGFFACCGILFNHEGPLRGIDFVTRKITDGIARIYLGLQDSISLGSLEAKRDWGYASDFVEGMWLMLQHSVPGDYILATRQAYSIEDFVQTALKEAGIYGPVEKFIKQDPEFMRPADVGHLLGDYKKAEETLGWKPKTSFEQMISIMIEADIRRVKNENTGN